MADISGVTAVQPTENTISTRVNIGESVGLAQCVFQSSTGLWMLSDADDPTKATVEGITMTTGTESCIIATGGSIVLVGASLVITETYIASDAPGGIKPVGDKDLGDIVSYVGIAATTTQLDLFLKNTDLMSSS